MKQWQKEIITWMATGETGMSSKTLAFAALGELSGRISYPYDPADLRRCLLLIRRCPKVSDAILILADHNKQWAALAKEWDALTHMLEDEIGHDLPSYGWEAPKTYHAMKALRV